MVMHGGKFFGWIGFLLLSGWSAQCQVRVPRLVGDGMVLQRDIPIRIWGFGSPGERVTVKFDGETGSAVTDDNGRWLVIFSPKKAGGPYTMDIDGINHIWIQNIMVGEVWFCSGGTGMQLTMEKVKDRYADLIAGRTGCRSASTVSLPDTISRGRGKMFPRVDGRLPVPVLSLTFPRWLIYLP